MRGTRQMAFSMHLRTVQRVQKEETRTSLEGGGFLFWRKALHIIFCHGYTLVAPMRTLSTFALTPRPKCASNGFHHPSVFDAAASATTRLRGPPPSRYPCVFQTYHNCVTPAPPAPNALHHPVISHAPRTRVLNHILGGFTTVFMNSTSETDPC